MHVTICHEISIIYFKEVKNERKENVYFQRWSSEMVQHQWGRMIESLQIIFLILVSSCHSSHQGIKYSEVYFSPLNQDGLYESLFSKGCSKSKSEPVLGLAFEKPDSFWYQFWSLDPHVRNLTPCWRETQPSTACQPLQKRSRTCVWSHFSVAAPTGVLGKGRPDNTKLTPGNTTWKNHPVKPRQPRECERVNIIVVLSHYVSGTVSFPALHNWNILKTKRH